MHTSDGSRHQAWVEWLRISLPEDCWVLDTLARNPAILSDTGRPILDLRPRKRMDGTRLQPAAVVSTSLGHVLMGLPTQSTAHGQHARASHADTSATSADPARSGVTGAAEMAARSASGTAAPVVRRELGPQRTVPYRLRAFAHRRSYLSCFSCRPTDRHCGRRGQQQHRGSNTPTSFGEPITGALTSVQYLPQPGQTAEATPEPRQADTRSGSARRSPPIVPSFRLASGGDDLPP